MFSKAISSIALSCALALAAGCQPGGGDAVNGASGPVASNPPTPTPPAPTPPAPTPPTPPPTGGTTQRQIGAWSERILNADGSINQTEYRAVAAAYNTEEMLQYRLGPTAADFGNATNTAPTLWGPDPTGRGLWPFGPHPANNPGEPEKCVRSDQLPGSEAEERARGFNGAGWQTQGQHAFLPDAGAAPEYRYGVSNTRNGDGNYFNTGGACLRMFASWQGDWWNRNNISTPSPPDVVALFQRRPNTPTTPVALARSRTNTAQIGFAAFRDGTIVPIRNGNTVADNFGQRELSLPEGMTPTAMAVTPGNEFLVVSVWDTNTVSGKLAFIALRTRQLAVGDPSQTSNTRYFWGLPGAWTVTHMKLLGFVDLPFAAPTSLDVSNHLIVGNPRGNANNDNPAEGDLSRQSVRDAWRGHPWQETSGPDEWKQTAQQGYVVVASRAEGLVSFVDMAPLYQHYREMYLTTEANYRLTQSFDSVDGARFPFSFIVRPNQRPVINTTIAVPQPTAVSAGISAKGTYLDRGNTLFETGGVRSPKDNWSGLEPERYIARSRAFVASMDGTVRIFNVQGLNLPGSPVGRTVPTQPIGQFTAGRNPQFAFVNAISTAVDDLFVVSRGDRTVTFAFPTGEVQSVLRDNRLQDPVGGSVSLIQGGPGGSIDGQAVFANSLSILDFNGKSIHTYAVEPRRGRLVELYPFRAPSGAVDFLYGSTESTPGKPFQFNHDETI